MYLDQQLSATADRRGEQRAIQDTQSHPQKQEGTVEEEAADQDNQTFHPFLQSLLLQEDDTTTQSDKTTLTLPAYSNV